jgi:hypothetical protein
METSPKVKSTVVMAGNLSQGIEHCAVLTANQIQMWTTEVQDRTM